MSIADSVLLRCGARMSQAQWKDIQALGRQAGAQELRSFTTADLAYAFFDFSPARDIVADALRELERKAGEVMKGVAVNADALKLVNDLPGASAGFPAPVHYIVEMDFAPGAEAEHARWYAEEHLPGLASVPGCVQARRYLSEAGRSYACYDLHSNLVPQSPEWARWRETAWTLRLREHHRDMRRNIFITM